MKVPRRPGHMTADEVAVLAKDLSWMKQDHRLRHCETVAIGILEHAEDPRHDEARAILQIANQIRRNHRRGWDIGGEMAELEALAARANMKLILPDAKRGAKVTAGARQGHETVHGDETAKRARWRAMATDFVAAREAGRGKTAAYEIAADKHGVSSKTIQRALKYLE